MHKCGLEAHHEFQQGYICRYIYPCWIYSRDTYIYRYIVVWNVAVYVVHSTCLCTLSASNAILIWNLHPVATSSYPYCNICLISAKIFIENPCLYAFLGEVTAIKPPMHLQLRHHPSMCTNKWCSLASTPCPRSVQCRNALELIAHPWEFPNYIQVAVLN